MLGNYFLTMLRSAQRDFAYFLINLAGLVTGLTCFIVLGLYLQNQFSYDRHFDNHEDIYRMVQERTTADQTIRIAPGPAHVSPILKERYPEVIEQARFFPYPQNGTAVLRTGDLALSWNSIYFADPSVFRLFPLELVYGDADTALTAPEYVAISESVARAYFGSGNPIGETLSTDTADLVVNAVFADLPSNTHMPLNILVSYLRMEPSRAEAPVAQASWSTNEFVFLQMEAGYNPADFAAISQAYYDEYMAQIGQERGASVRFYLEPLASIHLNSDTQRDFPRGNLAYLLTFGAMALLVLFIAILNYVNLGTVRSLRRGREVAIRKTVGASKSQLVVQYLIEATTFSALAVLLAGLLVALLLRITGIEQLLGANVVFNPADNPAAFIALTLLIPVMGVLSGFYPAVFLAAIRPVGAMRSLKGAAAWVRQGLMFAQFTMSAVVVICALVMAGQLRYLQNQPLGFEPDNLVIVTLRGVDVIEKIPLMQTDLPLDTRVVSVAEAPNIPGMNVDTWGGQVEDENGVKQQMNMSLMYINTGYTETFGIPVVEGRALSPALDDPHQGIVNETFVKNMGWSSAIGKEITYPGQPDHVDTIIGVVKDFHFHSLHQPVEPLAMFLTATDFSWANEIQRQIRVSYVAVRLAKGAGQSALDYLKGKFAEYDPNHPFEYRYMNDILDELYLSETRQITIVTLISAICVVISYLGLFGLSAFNASRRTKELSIRRVLSATTMNLLALLFRHSAILITTACIIAAIVAAALMNEWFKGFAIRESLGSYWPVFTLTPVAALVIAFGTIALQSYKTVTSNPCSRLRED